MTALLIFFLVIILLLTLYYVKQNGKTKLQLPTFAGWPIVGNIFQIDKDRPDFTLIKWAQELGPVYSVQLFNQTWVIVAGYEEIHELLVTKGNSFAGRHRRVIFDLLTYGSKDVVNGDPTQYHWLPMRKAAHRGIRHYGSGLNRLEAVLSTTAQDFVVKVTSYNGAAADLREDIYNFVLKVAVTMLCGRKVNDEADEIFKKMKVFEKLITVLTTPPKGVILDLMPWLQHCGIPVVKEIQNVCRLRDEMWDEMLQDCQETYSSDGDASCIMHSIAQLLDKNSQYYDSLLSEEHAKALFFDLVLASIITTSNFSYVLPNILAHHQDKLQLLQQEVDRVVGRDRPPSIFDRDQMPYSVATIYELLRYASLLPTLPHVALETETLGGFTIPAGTVIMPFYSALHYNEKFWGDPEVFRPERFLDDNGKLLPADHPNRKHVLQFGAGPRSCVGETFALKRLFIFLVSIVQQFEVHPDEQSIVPCNYKSYKNGGILCHQPYKVKLTQRQQYYS